MTGHEMLGIIHKGGRATPKPLGRAGCVRRSGWALRPSNPDFAGSHDGVIVWARLAFAAVPSRAARLARHEPGSRESIRGSDAQCLCRLLGIAAGRHRRGVAEVSRYLFEGHAVVDQQGGCGMANAM